MMTTKQRAALRSMGAMLQPILHIGKEGIGPTLLKQAYDALEARELIKVTVQRNAPYTAREACEELCEKVHAEPVQVIGNRFVIYRESREHKTIDLDALL
ncbi:MAG: ribosome assembly RNA-binding protein YhbY [Clostridia bacterium]|nr:ribosome assembly RNA-binding protein YhbY [Clostridia bacterium]MBQ2433174.1 ribosome assembly RNA-binding protein YhbY [Clostridia bacterium]